MMWLPLALLVLAGVVTAEHQHGWKVGNEYTYLVRSTTLTGLDQLDNQFTGILLKGLLVVQVKDEHTLGARLNDAKYARIHNKQPNGWDSELSDQMLELRDLPISGRPFEIKIKHGMIRDLVVDKDIPTWELNILKSIVSQFQVDTQGENAIWSKSIQVPEDQEPFGMFKAMEDSVGGKCEVHYDIMPLPEYVINNKPELVPMPQLKGDGQFIDITKTKNFSRCDQRMNYYFGLSEKDKWEPGSNENGNFLTRSSTSRIIISGNLKQFVIQSSVTTSDMLVSPRFYDFNNGIVLSRMNLTLVDLKKTTNPISSPTNPESTGNLVYTYNNPFADFNDRKPGKPAHSFNSKQIQTSDSISSVSSSEEALKNELNPRDSSSSSDSSSSISSSEENTFWQTKPSLEQAPQNPLLPNFIGYKGKSIEKSGQIDLVKATRDVLSQIAMELENPSDMPTQDTLEKFTILTSLMRTMNYNQLKQVDVHMHVSPNELKPADKSQAIKQNTWAVFRDAITQAGTGPALLLIKDWIEKEQIRGWEAADVVSRLPKTARVPTAEYVKALFQLATNPKVKEQDFLNSTAILAFTELVRNSQVNRNSIHNRYPVHTFGRLTSKHDKTVVEEYIPHLERELKNAVRDKDSRKIQTYILALGSIAHPKILSVFEPYLEGKAPSTAFQRTLIVGCLGRLIEINPKLARSVLYKIYLNTMEAHEVRCMAVYLLMKTNPPLSMLQRMAEFTKYDTSKQVNSAVKSALESMTTLTNPAHQDMANKARSAVTLLNEEEYSYQFSHGKISDTVSEDDNTMKQEIFSYIGSDDIFIPRAVYFESESSYGGFTVPKTELFAMVSSVRQLLTLVRSTSKNQKRAENWATEKIAEELNIIPEELDQLEGNVAWDTKFDTKFLPFDSNVVRAIPNLLANYAMGMKNAGYTNWNKLISYEVTLSFPTETGLPYVHSFKLPILYKLSSENQLQMNSDTNINLKSDARLVYSRKIQGRIGFVVPFEHQHYISGIDVNLQLFAPLRVSLAMNGQKKDVQLKLWPLKGEEKARLMHYNVVPYTSNHDILSLAPLSTERNTHVVSAKQIQSETKHLPLKAMPIFKAEIQADPTNEEFLKMGPTNLHKLIQAPWNLDDDTFRKVDVYMNLDREQKEPLIFAMTLDSLDAETSPEESRQWQPTATAVEPVSKKPNSEERRKQLLKEAAKGIKAARSQVVDVELQVPGEYGIRSLITLAWSLSNVENKGRMLSFWRFEVPKEDLKYEVCTSAQAAANDDTVLYFDKVRQSKPKVTFDVDIRHGETCNQHIRVLGKAIQTENVKKEIQEAQEIKECLEQMKQGNKILRNCQIAAAKAMAVNQLDMSIDVESETLRELIDSMVEGANEMELINVKMDTTEPLNAGKQKIDMQLKFSKDFETADIAVHTWSMDMEVKNVEISDNDVSSQSMLATTDNMDVRSLTNDEDEASCVLDKTRAETFDGKEYPLRLGKCWHVAMTTFPKKNPANPTEKLHIPQGKSVSIMTRETEDGMKELKIVLGQDEIQLLPSSKQPKVLVNNEQIEITDNKIFQKRKEDSTMFNIYKLWDDSIGVVSDVFDVDLVFDGERVLIKASDKYRDSVRGLCGNFDGDSINDFMGPKKCILKKPEEFTATYALTKDQCEGLALENAKRKNTFECMEQKDRLSNVINDVEAGRASVQSSNWGYHRNQQAGDKRCTIYRTQVMEINNKICFTTRPVISCARGCSATEEKSKNYQFHCMQNNQAAFEMKKRVEKGANPDLSQKPVTLSRQINVPLACKAQFAS